MALCVALASQAEKTQQGEILTKHDPAQAQLVEIQMK
jgi:hypothetical protein